MKTKAFGLYIVALLLSSCAPVANPPEPGGLAVPSISSASSPVTSTAVLNSPPSTTINSSSFVEPDPETYVAVLPAVLEYFYYRKKAVVSGKVEDLWVQYPELKIGMDPLKGINAEAALISNYRGLPLFDGNVFPEEYERFRVKQQGEEMEVLVHGMELYLYRDGRGQLNESGGEFKIVLSMRRQDGFWHVYKTDEVLQSEWLDFSP